MRPNLQTHPRARPRQKRKRRRLRQSRLKKKHFQNMLRRLLQDRRRVRVATEACDRPLTNIQSTETSRRSLPQSLYPESGRIRMVCLVGRTGLFQAGIPSEWHCQGGGIFLNGRTTPKRHRCSASWSCPHECTTRHADTVESNAREDNVVASGLRPCWHINSERCGEYAMETAKEDEA